MLLGKVASLDEVLTSKWMAAVPKEAEVHAELTLREAEAQKIREERRSKSQSSQE